jgi:hypothetical protein
MGTLTGGVTWLICSFHDATPNASIVGLDYLEPIPIPIVNGNKFYKQVSKEKSSSFVFIYVLLTLKNDIGSAKVSSPKNGFYKVAKI